MWPRETVVRRSRFRETRKESSGITFLRIGGERVPSPSPLLWLEIVYRGFHIVDRRSRRGENIEVPQWFLEVCRGKRVEYVNVVQI